MLTAFLLLLCGATALRLSPLPPTDHRPNTRLPAAKIASSSALTTFVPAAFADAYWDQVYVEINRPPISLNPFHINPAGYFTFGAYALYLFWQINKPSSEAEIALAAKQEAEAAEAVAAAPAFLQAASEQPGAKVLPSGLVFEELVAGDGDAPIASQTVSVHYVGTLANGTEFDSSIARGEPTEFKVEQVIAGWQEGLQLMKQGGKARLTIPASLAYGQIPVGKIPGNSALAFEVELLEVKKSEGGGFFGMGA